MFLYCDLSTHQYGWVGGKFSEKVLIRLDGISSSMKFGFEIFMPFSGFACRPDAHFWDDLKADPNSELAAYLAMNTMIATTGIF